MAKFNSKTAALTIAGLTGHTVQVVKPQEEEIKPYTYNSDYKHTQKGRRKREVFKVCFISPDKKQSCMSVVHTRNGTTIFQHSSDIIKEEFARIQGFGIAHLETLGRFTRNHDDCEYWPNSWLLTILMIKYQPEYVIQETGFTAKMLQKMRAMLYGWPEGDITKFLKAKEKEQDNDIQEKYDD